MTLRNCKSLQGCFRYKKVQRACPYNWSHVNVAAYSEINATHRYSGTVSDEKVMGWKIHCRYLVAFSFQIYLWQLKWMLQYATFREREEAWVIVPITLNGLFAERNTSAEWKIVIKINNCFKVFTPVLYSYKVKLPEFL